MLISHRLPSYNLYTHINKTWHTNRTRGIQLCMQNNLLITLRCTDTDRFVRVNSSMAYVGRRRGHQAAVRCRQDETARADECNSLAASELVPVRHRSLDLQPGNQCRADATESLDHRPSMLTSPDQHKTCRLHTSSAP